MKSLYQTIIARLEAFTAGNYWEWKLVILLVAYIHVVATPSYQFVDFNNEGWIEVKRKLDDLLAPVNPHINDPGDNHSTKFVLRLTVPAIAKALHLSPTGILVANFIVGVGVLYLFIVLSARITDRVGGLLMGISAASIYLGKASFGDFFPLFDGWAYFFLLLSLRYRWPWLIFFSSFLAAWTDERAFLALYFVYCWWKYSANSLSSLGIQSFFKLDWQVSAVLAGMVGYIGLRFFLKQQYDLSTPMYDVMWYVMYNLPFIRFGIWTYFEGLWLLIVAAIVLGVIKYPKNLFLLLTVLGFAAFTAGTIMIGDLTRSGTYAFPMIFICLLLLKNLTDLSEIKMMLFVSTVVCVLFPPVGAAANALARWSVSESILIDAFRFFYYGIWLPYVR